MYIYIYVSDICIRNIPSSYYVKNTEILEIISPCQHLTTVTISSILTKIKSVPHGE